MYILRWTRALSAGPFIFNVWSYQTTINRVRFDDDPTKAKVFELIFCIYAHEKERVLEMIGGWVKRIQCAMKTVRSEFLEKIQR